MRDRRGLAPSINTIIDLDAFFAEAMGRGFELRKMLWPLTCLNPRERAVFSEYHYWKTHMKDIARSHRVSLGRAYEILYRAEDKIASARAQKAEKGSKDV